MDRPHIIYILSDDDPDPVRRLVYLDE